MRGSRATLASSKSLSHHTPLDSADDEGGGSGHDVVKDCNGRIIPRFLIRAPTVKRVRDRLPLTFPLHLIDTASCFTPGLYLIYTCL